MDELTPEEITPIIAKEVEKHFKLYPDARLWITKLANDIHEAQLAKVLRSRPELREKVVKGVAQRLYELNDYEARRQPWEHLSTEIKAFYIGKYQSTIEQIQALFQGWRSEEEVGEYMPRKRINPSCPRCGNRTVARRGECDGIDQ